ncbi:vacuolar-type H+-ATPase subunit E/Vma4 [Crossiella equi]|uniref:Vacuolar-type H+-ATPase subunit E/Vma4 n=1 Tax=Crossiella equi TaxID=130796 RepID=A0ABS5AQL3_9PSEU|nr:hypothetical protein [Crossiella equi]MBP2478848.1 vacuolar-type H+-ATPase subunit E/Vma4 [Crossiella equi]
MSGAEITAALRPVREELLRRARADAERTVAQAGDHAARVLEDAERAAAAIRERARAQGAAEGAAAATARRAQARARVHAAELRARAQVYGLLRAQVRAELRGLRDGPEYPRLRELLAAEARRLLGAAASVTEAPGGGVLADGDGARADCSLDGFAERAVAALGPELEGLWRP